MEYNYDNLMTIVQWNASAEEKSENKGINPKGKCKF